MASALQGAARSTRRNVQLLSPAWDGAGHPTILPIENPIYLQSIFLHINAISWFQQPIQAWYLFFFIFYFDILTWLFLDR